jgi:hypothetical protein
VARKRIQRDEIWSFLREEKIVTPKILEKLRTLSVDVDGC